MRRFALALCFTMAAVLDAKPVLKVSLSGVPKQVRPDETVSWTATVQNTGSDAAHDVVFNTALYPGPVCAEITMPVLEPGAQQTLSCSRQPGVHYVQEVQVYARSREFVSDSTYQQIELITQPDLVVTGSIDKPVDPALPFNVTFKTQNVARTNATGVTLAIDLTGAAGVVSVPEECGVRGLLIDCSLGVLLAKPLDAYEPQKKSVTISVLAPDASLATIGATAAARSKEGDNRPADDRTSLTTLTFHTFFVTNEGDDAFGGTLRAAIDAANAATCRRAEPCKIAFRIPTGNAKWLTIRPLTPLPAVKSDSLIIDGTTQTRYYGNVNPDGPEIELTGVASATGNGLQIDKPCIEVNGLAINGFAENGVEYRFGFCAEQGRSIVKGCYIGTDPTGTRAVPNERGVFINASIGGVAESVISGNRRSGVFIADEGFGLINSCVIGLNAAKSAPLGNGASGVYIAQGASGSDVKTSYIGFNHHSGVSIAEGGYFAELGSNSFQGNWQLAIDYGLNGVTRTIPFAAMGRNGVIEPSVGELAAPEITSAVYDPVTNVTTIEAKVVPKGPATTVNEYRITFYANDAPDESGYGEGQYYLGNVGGPVAVLKWPGRTPGPWISATATGHTFWGFLRTPDPDGAFSCGDCGYSDTTSEFGKTVRVKE